MNIRKHISTNIKRTFTGAKQFLLILSICVVCAACHKDDHEEGPKNEHFRRTVLVYMAMQNSLGSSGYHKSDSAEIVNAMQYIPEDDRLLLFIDDARKPRIYELNRHLAETDKKTGMPYGPKLLKRWEQERSSASGEMLTEVLRYARENFEADEYGLVMGSHATGWLPQGKASEGLSARRALRRTFGIDVGPEGSMASDKGVAGSVPDEIEIDDLAAAIKASGVHPEFVLFDACLMQNVEVAYTMRDVTDYIIASPISISAEGAYYTDLVRMGLFTSDPVDVARTYADYYLGRGSIPYTDGYGTVISCVRTAAVERLASTVSDLLHELAPAGSAAERIEVLKRRDASRAFYYHTYCKNFYWRPHYYDLVSAFEALGATPEQMERLLSAVDEAVAYKAANKSYWIGPSYNKIQIMPTDDSAWCGVSMFVPQQVYTDNAPRCIFGDLNEKFKQTEWFKRVY